MLLKDAQITTCWRWWSSVWWKAVFHALSCLYVLLIDWGIWGWNCEAGVTRGGAIGLELSCPRRILYKRMALVARALSFLRRWSQGILLDFAEWYHLLMFLRWRGIKTLLTLTSPRPSLESCIWLLLPLPVEFHQQALCFGLVLQRCAQQLQSAHFLICCTSWSHRPFLKLFRCIASWGILRLGLSSNRFESRTPFGWAIFPFLCFLLFGILFIRCIFLNFVLNHPRWPRLLISCPSGIIRYVSCHAISALASLRGLLCSNGWIHFDEQLGGLLILLFVLNGTWSWDQARSWLWLRHLGDRSHHSFVFAVLCASHSQPSLDRKLRHCGIINTSSFISLSICSCCAPCLYSLLRWRVYFGIKLKTFLGLQSPDQFHWLEGIALFGGCLWVLLPLLASWWSSW